MAPPSKEQMMCVLEGADVDVPNTATISQIRALYQELLQKNRELAESTDDEFENGNDDVTGNHEPTDGNESQVAVDEVNECDELLNLDRQLAILTKKDK